MTVFYITVIKVKDVELVVTLLKRLEIFFIVYNENTCCLNTVTSKHINII